MMADWNNAESTFLLAAAKTYAALGIANPSGTYSSSLFVTLNIDGVDYQCRCDCTGVIQTIIHVMGYDPNWGQSSVPGHVGDAWYLTDATESFVKDKQGNITADWEVLDFDVDDVRPGDIRAASSHSHCDIFVDYIDGNAYGLNAGAVNAIQASTAAGSRYLQNNDESELAVTWTIQDSDTAKILRFVKDSQVNPDNVVIDSSQSLKSLDIDLKFKSRLEFRYHIMGSEGLLTRVVPGYFPKVELYPTSDGIHANDTYGDAWLTFMPNYTYRWSDAPDDADWKAIVQSGLIMLYTLDNSDPMTCGRTVYLHDDGTNDYERSKGYVPVVRTQFPVHFRCSVTDSNHQISYGNSSAWFSNESAEDKDITSTQHKKAYNYSMFLSDASDKSPEAEDNHGYLFINDEDTVYDRSDYVTWVQGVEEE